MTITEMLRLYPPPWQWGEDWGKIDHLELADANDDEYNSLPKYADLALRDKNGKQLLPLQIDHRQPIIDTDNAGLQAISPAIRRLIAAAPAIALLLAKFSEDMEQIHRFNSHNFLTKSQIDGNIAARAVALWSKTQQILDDIAGDTT